MLPDGGRVPRGHGSVPFDHQGAPCPDEAAELRFDLKYGLPGLTHDQLMTNIELDGHQVIPRVRELLS